MNQTATITKPIGANTFSDGVEAPAAFVSFVVDEQLLGVPVQVVQEVLNPQTIARVPKAKCEIAGLINLRGEIVTAVDLRQRLNLPPADRQTSMNIVVRHNDESYSLLVDGVGDVLDVSGETLQPLPRTLDARWRSVACGIYRLENQLFVILSVPDLLNF